MNPVESLPSGIEVLRAAPEQQPVLANLLELYAYDFSELLDLHPGPDGRFGYPMLPLYWSERGRFPFLVTVDGRPGGLALVTRGSRIRGDSEVWDMAEFFVVRAYRTRGVGMAVAHWIWRRFPGVWEVRVLEANEPARAFWAAAVGAFTRSPAEAELVEVEGRRWRVFSFASPGGAEPG